MRKVSYNGATRYFRRSILRKLQIKPGEEITEEQHLALMAATVPYHATPGGQQTLKDVKNQLREMNIGR